MEDDQDKNPFDQFDAAPQTAPVAPARPTLTVRPLGTGTKTPAPQTQTQAAIDDARLRNEQLDIAKKEKEASGVVAQTPPQMEAARNEALDKIALARRLMSRSQENWTATGSVFTPIMGSIPGTVARDVALDTETLKNAAALQRIMEMAQANGGKNPLTPLSNSDFQALASSLTNLDPTQGDEQYQRNLSQIMDLYTRMYQSAGGQDLEGDLGPERGGNVFGRRRDEKGAMTPNGGPAQSPPTAPSTGGGPAPSSPDIDRSSKLYVEDTSPGEAQITTAPIKYATETDKRVGAVLQTVLDRGGSVDEANRVLNQYGYTAPIGAESWNDAVQYNKTRPKGAPKAKVAPPETGMRELSDYQKAVGNFATSTLGGATIGALNGITAGTIDEIGGGIDAIVNDKPFDQAIAEANLKKDLVRRASPTAYTVGEIGGGVAGSLATGGVVGGGVRGAAGAFAPRAIAGDVAYGAAYGAGENNADRLTGGVAGALTSAAGGVAGRGAARGVAGAVAPLVDPAIRTLRDRGVRLSLGQAIGPRAAQFEEKLGSIPVIGGMVRNVRERSIGDFNKAVVDDALAPIGKALPEGTTGTAAIRYADDAFRDAYDAAKSRMSLRPDGQMAADLQDLERRVTGGQLDSESAKRIRNMYNNEVARKLSPSGISGSTYKEIDSALGKQRRGTFQSNRELSDAIAELQGILSDTARRSSPADAVQALNKADEGYALFVRAQEAAKMRAGETANFTPLQYDAAVQRADLTTRNRAYLRGEARGQELAEAGKQVLRDRIPNSGTFDRAAAGWTVAGGAGALFAPKTLAGLAGVAAAYAPGIRTALPAALTRNSSPAAQAVANAIRNRGRMIGAATSSPLLLAYSPDR